MRPFLRSLFLLFPLVLHAAPVTVHLSAPTYAGERILLYRCTDLFTPRTELLADTRIGADGRAVLEADVTGTTKAMIRVGVVVGDLWLRPGTYHVEMPAPDPAKPRSINGTTRVDLLFTGLDLLDVNALVTDLNERLDAFVAEDLATDEAAGMQALDIVRSRPATEGGGRLHPDTAKRPGTLFITPGWSEARVDTFERKLCRFYAEVDDPWFQADLEYGLAGLRFGPRANDRALFERYLKDKPVRYDVPEYVRFITSFFAEHLMRYPFRSDPDRLTAFIRQAEIDSVKALLVRNDFLRDDARLRELVLMNELYADHGGQLFDRDGILRMLEQLSTSSAFPEHRAIAANMVWDLTAMHAGATLPSLTLPDPEGAVVPLDSLLQGPVCLMVTAGWCSYCEEEMVAAEQLYKEYGAYVRFIAISLDRSMEALKGQLKAHPGRKWTWLFAGDDPVLMDALRIRSVPTFFLLNGRVLAHAPAPPPSAGLGAILHGIRVRTDEEHRIKPDRGMPPRQR